MNKTIKLAGIPIEIHTLFDSLFRAEEYETDEAPVFSVRTTQRDIMAEREKSMAEAVYEGIVYPNYSPAQLENTAVYRKIADRLPEYDGLVFHGSAVAVGERAYLFSAKSGTGKTTHTRLWLQNIKDSYVVNGDKPILRIMDGKPFVCGTPWMGKEGYGCNRNVPLSAICILHRGAENHIEKTDFAKVYLRLIGQAYRPENGALVVKTIKLLERLGQLVPIYELFCNMENTAAFVSFGGMTDASF